MSNGRQYIGQYTFLQLPFCNTHRIGSSRPVIPLNVLPYILPCSLPIYAIFPIYATKPSQEGVGLRHKSYYLNPINQSNQIYSMRIHKAIYNIYSCPFHLIELLQRMLFLDCLKVYQSSENEYFRMRYVTLKRDITSFENFIFEIYDFRLVFFCIKICFIVEVFIGIYQKCFCTYLRNRDDISMLSKIHHNLSPCFQQQ